MLTIGAMPILLNIVAKIDIKPVIVKLKDLDIFDNPESGKDAINQLSKEKLGILAMEIITELTPQLAKISGDIPLFVAAYKGITVEEAQKLDAAEVINEIINDKGVLSFFKRAFSKKVEREA